MTLQDFRSLPIEEQTDLVYKDGVYIGKNRSIRGFHILFQLQDFYVEVAYLKYRYFVSHVRCFGSTRLISKYLNQIDVEDLIKNIPHIHLNHSV